MDAELRDAAAVARELVPRLRRWTPANWSVPAEPPTRSAEPTRPRSRADAVAGVVQRLADAGADAEGRLRRRVPRDPEINLADQLAVMVDDIRRAGDPAALRTAAAELAALRRALGFR
jgi:hypothetical protein